MITVVWGGGRVLIIATDNSTQYCTCKVAARSRLCYNTANIGWKWCSKFILFRFLHCLLYLLSFLLFCSACISTDKTDYFVGAALQQLLIAKHHTSTSLRVLLRMCNDALISWYFTSGMDWWMNEWMDWWMNKWMNESLNDRRASVNICKGSLRDKYQREWNTIIQLWHSNYSTKRSVNRTFR